jgi:hypothetical protein
MRERRTGSLACRARQPGSKRRELLPGLSQLSGQSAQVEALPFSSAHLLLAVGYKDRG